MGWLFKSLLLVVAVVLPPIICHWVCCNIAANKKKKALISMITAISMYNVDGQVCDRFTLSTLYLYIDRRACGHGDWSPSSFGSHLNSISTKGGRLCPSYTDVPEQFWKPQARLIDIWSLFNFCRSVESHFYQLIWTNLLCLSPGCCLPSPTIRTHLHYRESTVPNTIKLLTFRLSRILVPTHSHWRLFRLLIAVPNSFT